MTAGPRAAAGILLVTAALGTAADLASKAAVFARLPTPRDRITLIEGLLEFSRVENTGMMWGIGQGVVSRGLWIAVRAAVLLFVVAFFFRSRTRSSLAAVATGLIVAGALGNLHDNVFHVSPFPGRNGAVRDFIHVLLPSPEKSFPVFNLADSFICIGAPLLLIALSRDARRCAAAAAPDAPA